MSPLYLHSLIMVDSSLHPNNLVFSIHSRSENIGILPDGYRSHCPLVAYVVEPDSVTRGKSKKYAINWVEHEDNIEIINCANGLANNDMPSRLCKSSMYEQFCAIWHRMEPGTRCSDVIPAVYSDAKQAVGAYHGAKNQMIEAIQNNGYGKLLTKPQEIDMFSFKNKCEVP